MYSIKDKKIDVIWLLIIVSVLILMYWQGVKNEFCGEVGERFNANLIAKLKTSFDEELGLRFMGNCKQIKSK